MAASSPAPTPSRRRAIVAASVGNALGVVRLDRLRHLRDLLQQPVLPAGQRDRRPAGRLRHIRRGLHHAPARRVDHRRFRGSPGAQGRARSEHLDDVGRFAGHRPFSNVRRRGDRRARHPDPGATGAGTVAGRTLRLGDHPARRNRARQTPRLLLELRVLQPGRRHPGGLGARLGAHDGPDRRSDEHVGLARALHSGRRRRADQPLDSAPRFPSPRHRRPCPARMS